MAPQALATTAVNEDTAAVGEHCQADGIAEAPKTWIKPAPSVWQRTNAVPDNSGLALPAAKGDGLGEALTHNLTAAPAC